MYRVMESGVSPWSEEAQIRLSLRAWRRGDSQQALAWIETVDTARLSGLVWLTYLNFYGLIHIEAGQFENAQRCFEEALRRCEPGSKMIPMLMQNLGES